MPGPLAYAAVAGTAASGVMGFKANRAMGKAAEQKAQYDREVAEQEAILQRRKLRDDHVKFRTQADQLKSAQVVATAASGVQMTGSPATVAADTYFQLAKDEAMLLYSGDVAETQLETRVAMTDYEGKVRKGAANYQAMTTLLGSTAKTYGTGYDLGVFS